MEELEVKKYSKKLEQKIEHKIKMIKLYELNKSKNRCSRKKRKKNKF